MQVLQDLGPILLKEEVTLAPGVKREARGPDNVKCVIRTPYGRVAAWLRARPLAADALFAVALFAVSVLLWVTGPRAFQPASWPVGLAWTAVALLPVVIRRRWLWWAFAGTLAVVLVPLLPVAFLRPAWTSQGLTVMVITYTMAAYERLWRAALATVVLWIPVEIAWVVVSADYRHRLSADLYGGMSVQYGLMINLLSALVVFFVGRTAYNRRGYAAALEDRAATAEAAHRTIAEQAVGDERRRIARELHDVVAHHVSVMNVLATGARRTLTRDPDAADEALATISDTGRTVLREMRRLLDVLRTDDEPDASLVPQPGLAGVEQLVEQVREAGLPVALRVSGQPYPMDPGVALTVYRIAQEALTNALKHAGQARAEVRLSFEPGGVCLEVADNGRGPRPGTPHLGHGLVGMRERVALYGGALRTGPRPGGGFRVLAMIPVDQPVTEHDHANVKEHSEGGT